MACQAQRRKRFNDPRWECDGTDLAVVMWVGSNPNTLPVVCPRGRLDELLASEYGSVYQPEPFTGGDHYHVVLS